MGQRRIVCDVSDLAVAFASLVTTHSDYEYDWVARRGRMSIFSLLYHLAPQVRILVVLIARSSL